MAVLGWAGISMSIVQMGKYKTKKKMCPSHTLLNDELIGLLAPRPRVFSFILCYLPRNKTVECDRLHNQKMSEVVRETWETKIEQEAKDIVKEAPGYPQTHFIPL